MADSIEGRRTGFADLPAELRNVIYCFALASPVSIQLHAPGETTATIPATICPNILRVCRFITREAAPILYAWNTFGASARTLCDWMKQINGNKRHLRSIAITTCPKLVDLRRVLKALSNAPYLGQLHFLYTPWSRTDDFSAGPGQSKFAKLMLPFLHAWYKQHEWADSEAAVDILKFWFPVGIKPRKQEIYNWKFWNFREMIQRQLQLYDESEVALKSEKAALEDLIVCSAKDIIRRREVESAAADQDLGFPPAIESRDSNPEADSTLSVQGVPEDSSQDFDPYQQEDILDALRATVAAKECLINTDWSSIKQRWAGHKNKKKSAP